MLRSAAALAAIVSLSACSRPGATVSKADTSARAAATTNSAAGSVASGSVAPGTAAASAMPHDSISDRADRGRIAGDSSAKLWVIMASDFQCPYCKQWHDASFARLMRDYVAKGKIRLAFLNMPLSMHPNAMPAAEAAMCAAVQNKFWPMHEALFESQQQWEGLQNPVPELGSLAGRIGVNVAQWNDCMTNHSTRALVEADRDRARAAGVNSTPTFFVGSQTLAGADKDIAAAIDAALAKKTP